MRILLRRPDDDAGGDTTTKPKAGDKPPGDKPAGKDNETVKAMKGTKTAREIQLEKELARREDREADLTTQLEEATKLIEGAKRKPSKEQPGKSVLDEINEFLGFGPEQG